MLRALVGMQELLLGFELQLAAERLDFGILALVSALPSYEVGLLGLR